MGGKHPQLLIGGLTIPQAGLLYRMHFDDSRLITGSFLAWTERGQVKCSRLTVRILQEQGFLVMDDGLDPKGEHTRAYRLTDKAVKWLEKNMVELQRYGLGVQEGPNAGPARI